MPRRKRTRGHLVAILIGLEKNKASFWNIYSKSVTSDTVIEYEKDDYNYYKTIIDKIRPKIKQGIKTVIIASSEKKNYEHFYKHINKHQKWIISGYDLNRITLVHLESSAEDIDAVTELIKESKLQKIIKQTSFQENQFVWKELEKRLSTSNGIDNLLFTLKEIENIVYKEKSETRPEYILLTTDFQKRNHKRIQRLLQISQNKTIKTMIVEKNSSMGSRLSQFGGLICMVYQQNK